MIHFLSLIRIIDILFSIFLNLEVTNKVIKLWVFILVDFHGLNILPCLISSYQLHEDVENRVEKKYLYLYNIIS